MLCIRQNIIRQPHSIINSPKFSPTNIFRYTVVSNFDHKFAQTSIYHSLLSWLETIKLPCKMKKRGRPKGADKIVIGLIRKKSRENKPVSFLYKGAKQKELG